MIEIKENIFVGKKREENHMRKKKTYHVYVYNFGVVNIAFLVPRKLIHECTINYLFFLMHIIIENM